MRSTVAPSTRATSQSSFFFVRDAYRSAEKRAPLVLAARARAVTPLLALALVVATFAIIFAARASATLSCKRDPEHKERTTCFVEQASGWSRTQSEKQLLDAWGVTLERKDGVAHLIAATRDGRVDLLQSTASEDELRPFVRLLEDVAVDIAPSTTSARRARPHPSGARRARSGARAIAARPRAARGRGGPRRGGLGAGARRARTKDHRRV